jgi:hypothetical protein
MTFPFSFNQYYMVDKPTLELSIGDLKISKPYCGNASFILKIMDPIKSNLESQFSDPLAVLFNS